MNLEDVEWVATEPLYVTRLTEENDRLLVRDAGNRWALIMVFTDDAAESGLGSAILFNGEYVDVGDDFPVYLGVFDAASEWSVGVEVYQDAPEENDEE